MRLRLASWHVLVVATATALAASESGAAPVHAGRSAAALAADVETQLDSKGVPEARARRRLAQAWQPDPGRNDSAPPGAREAEQASKQPRSEGTQTGTLLPDEAAATVPCPITKVPLHPGFECEEPYGPHVRVHVIITMRDRTFYKDLRYLGMIGLTNAEVFTYIRKDPNDARAARVALPCGMRLRERLLLPNLGEEGAAFLTHVAWVYDDPPDLIITLHGGQLQAWHCHCSVAIRRMRALYRGLGAGASPAMRAFASNVRSLNSLTRMRPKAGTWTADNCCSPMLMRDASWSQASDGDFPECPWQRVGRAAILFEDVAQQALCQLRDRTPDTNWTVLATDIPEFFIRQREILAAYERDPLRRVPITHAHGQGMQAPAPAGVTSTPGNADAGLSGAAVLGESWEGASQDVRRRLRRRTRLLLEEVLSTARWGSDGNDSLVNLRDLVFPQHRARDLDRHNSNINHPIYGLERFWVWILKSHGLFEAFTRPARPGEVPIRWCCFQFGFPKHAIRRASKEWWQDAAFMTTHLGWKPWDEWRRQFGLLIEWRLLPSLDLGHMTKEDFQAYLDIEQEMGEDVTLARCASEEAAPLEE